MTPPPPKKGSSTTSSQPPNPPVNGAKVISLRQRLPRPMPEEKGIVATASLPPRRLTFSVLIMMIWAWTLMTLSPMLVLWLPNANAYLFGQNFILEPYSLQLACTVLVAGVFGARWGTVILVAYVLSGLLGLNVFSQGGGFLYYLNPGFGYLVGLALIPLFIQQELKKSFKGQKIFRGRILYLFFSAVIAVCVVNGCGLIVLLANALAGSLSWDQFFDYFHSMTINRVYYDLGFSFAAALMIRTVRLLFYPCFY